MKRSFVLWPLFLLGFGFWVPGKVALAGGWDNGILGPRGSAMGTAFAGLADDPSAIFYNPAGTALLEPDQGIAVTVRYNATYLAYEFPDGRLSSGGKDSGRSYLTGVIPDIFYYHRFGRFTAGLGVYVPYGGMAGSWPDEPFHVNLNQFMAVASFTPSVAWAVTPKFAIGAGVNIYFGFMKSKVRMDKIPLAMFQPLFPDDAFGIVYDVFDGYVPLQLKQDFYAKGLAVGYNAGALYKPFTRLSLGVAMRSGADVKLSGPSDIVVYLADPLAIYIHSDLKIKYKLPYLVVGGVAFWILPNLVVVADVQYNGWGRLEDIRLTFKSLNYTQVNKTGYEDTVKFMVGTEYTFQERYSIRMGYMFTPNNIKHEELLSYQSWDTDMHNFSVGFGYSWGNMSVHALAMISPGEWNTKHFDDPLDPVGKPAGKYTTFNQTYGIGCLWYF